VGLCAALALGQTNASAQSGSAGAAAGSRTQTVAGGQKMQVKGVVVKRDADSITVRDESGVDTVVRLSDSTSVTERKSNPFRSAKKYPVTSIVRGLSLEVEGRSDGSGQMVADKIKFSDTEYRVARSIESRVNPVEDRVGTAENRIGQAEQNAQRLSGQIDELAAVANAANGGAKAAQDTADRAVAGVNAANERISALDDYEPQQTISVNFKRGSALLSPEAKAQLDQIAQQAGSARGYMLEVTGFADSTGNRELNRRLSQQRAEAVVRYLAVDHKIPLRRIITPYGFGEAQPVADNSTREGRAQNRRVEVKMLVNRALTQPAASASAQTSSAQSNAASIPSPSQEK
jgi:outer membrane protein OmpA-like peptidoglycan-associated protein